MIYSYILADKHRLYGVGWQGAFKCILNPGFHAVLLIRLAQFSPSWAFWFWRNILIAKHGIDVGGGFYIGKSLRLPHPIGIVIGGGVTIGEFATIYQSVTIGKNKGGYPVIKNKVTIFSSSVVVGPIVIGSGVTIGALNYVDKNLQDGELIRGASSND